MGSSPIPATRPVGQEAKTPPFHGGNRSSILLRVTKRNKSELFRKSKLVRICFLLLIVRIDTEHHRRERPTVTLGGIILFQLNGPTPLFSSGSIHHSSW